MALWTFQTNFPKCPQPPSLIPHSRFTQTPLFCKPGFPHCSSDIEEEKLTSAASYHTFGVLAAVPSAAAAAFIENPICCPSYFTHAWFIAVAAARIRLLGQICRRLRLGFEDTPILFCVPRPENVIRHRDKSMQHHSSAATHFAIRRAVWPVLSTRLACSVTHTLILYAVRSNCSGPLGTQLTEWGKKHGKGRRKAEKVRNIGLKKRKRKGEENKTRTSMLGWEQ